MADRIRGHDWAATPLGPMTDWPASLMTIVNMMVSTPKAMGLVWGDALTMIYNDGYAPLLGLRHPEALGHPMAEVWSDIWPDISPLVEQTLSGHPVSLADMPLTMTRNGYAEETWWTFTYSAVHDDAGQIAGLIIITSESTQRVVSARESAEANQRLEMALSSGGGVGTWDWDVTNDRLRADTRFARIFGVDADRATEGATIDEYFRAIHPADVDRVQAEIAAALATGDLFSSEYRLVQSDGKVRWVAAQGRAILSPDGQPQRFPGVAFDVTDRRQVAARQAVLIALNDALRDLTDADDIAQASARVLAEALGVSRAGYGTIDLETETITIGRDYHQPGAFSLSGTLRFDDYGAFFDEIRRGETVVVTDVEADPRTKATAEAMRQIGVGATVNTPLLEQGKVVALMFVGSPTPRAWGETELELMREVTQRVRAAIERARSEAALRESEAQFRAFAQAVPNHVWASRPNGEIYWYNSQVYTYTGHVMGQLDGSEAWTAVLHPDDAATAAATWAQALASGQVYQTEFRIRRHDGEWRRFAVHAEPVRDDDGTIVRWVGANIDIEDIRLQGEELERVNDILSGLLAGSQAERDRLWTLSTDMLAQADYQGGLLAVNPAWTRTLGWSQHELLTNPYADIISPDDIAATTAALQEMGQTGRPTRFENRILSKDGQWKPIGWTVSPEPNSDFFIAIGRDLTEDKAREEQLLIAQEALRQSQKMEAVGQLTGGIAHDFNNLLAGISGALELLSKRLAEGRLNGMDRYIDAAQGSAQRAAALTQRLLAFSRRQTLDPKPTDVNRLIGGMEDLIRRSVGPNVEVEVVGAGGLWNTRIDQSQLENALLNLCINARDAMAPDGGRLTIETANKWLDDRAARERELPPGQYVTLCVTDTGTGMPPEVQAQAFDPFFTTKPLGQGTGLGLSMIHGFVRQSNGQVRIYSEVGSGTTMCLYLPRFNGSLDAGDTLEDAPVAEGGHGETVLVIDDEETVRMLVAEVLGEAGYTVIEAPDGPSGLDILRSDRRIDLLISDVGLPGGMNGRQVADAARVDRPDLRVLFITGYAENAAVGNGLLAPGMEVMTKPFVMADLATKVHEMIEG